jgi:hypothetical protein
MAVAIFIVNAKPAGEKQRASKKWLRVQVLKMFAQTGTCASYLTALQSVIVHQTKRGIRPH